MPYETSGPCGSDRLLASVRHEACCDADDAASHSNALHLIRRLFICATIQSSAADISFCIS